ncbi:MAG TPA: Ig-like domain-containing protein [Urbifossiella sp.]|nr:Ig-like domain-containing protein [Urbifossiella sp.]
MNRPARLLVEALDERINPSPAVTRLSADTFYIDKDPTPALTSAYVGYQIHGDGVIHRDVYAEISGFSAGIGLASSGPGATAPAVVRLGDLTAAGSLNAYFYLSGTESATAKTYSVTFYSGLPSQGNVLAAFGESLLAVEDTIQAAANKFTGGSVVSSGTLAIGSTFDLVLQGTTGTVGNPLIAYTPASLPDWLASSFQLVSTNLTFSSGDLAGAVVPAGSLFYSPDPSATSNSAYTITYTLRAINATSTTTSLTPITNIGSGTQVKHTDTGSWSTLPTIPAVVNNLTVGMTATPVAGGVSTVTLTVNNSGSVAAGLDQLRAVLPAGVTYVAGSATRGGVAYADPAVVGGELVWSDSYSVPAGQTLTLTFQVGVPAAGVFTVAGFARIGDTTIDTTAPTTDFAPATVTVAADATPPDTTITANPPALTNSAAATFQFTGSDAGGSGVTGFQYRVDGGTWTAAASPLTLSGLSDGPHTFEVRAVDAVGNIDPTPASYSWTIDTAAPGAPAVTGFSPDTEVPGDRITASTTLTLTGTAEANSTVTLVVDGVVFGTTTADASGNWSRAGVGVLAAGPRSFTARATDSAGNTSAPSAAFVVTIDATAPAAPVITGVTPDTGASPTDRITNTGGLTVTGTAEPNSTVRVFDNGTALGLTTADGSGNWSLAVALAEGSHPLTARATDVAGNASGPSLTAPVVVDLTAPDTALTGQPAAVAGSSSATFTFTGSDAGSGVAGFEYSLDGGAWIAATSPLTLTGLADGGHTFAVRAVDVAGNPDLDTNGSGYTWTVDTGAPAAPAITAVSPDAGASPTDRVTNTGTLTVTGTAEANSTVTVYDNGTLLGTTAANAAGVWTLPVTLAEATHPLTATATDAAGNTSAASAPAPVVVDTVAPTVGASAPAATTSTTPTVTVTAADTGSGVPNGTVVSVDVDLDGNGDFAGAGEVGYATGALAGGSAVVALPALAEGLYVYRVRLPDLAGNFGTSATVAFRVDTTAPDTTITAGPPAAADTGSTTFSFTGSDGGSGVAGFEYRLDGGSWLPSGSPQPLTGLADGAHTFEVRAIDAAGNVDPTPAAYSWTVDTGAPAAPAVTGITPDTGASPTDRVTNIGSLSVTGTAEANSTVTVYDGATLLGVVSANGSGNWTLPTTLAEGVHPLTATAADVAGNVSAASAVSAVRVDLTAPDTALTGQPVAISGSASATFTFTGSDADSGVAGFEYSLDGGPWAAAASPLTLTGLADGGHTFAVRAVDVAGNPDPDTSGSGYAWTVDTGAPTAPAITAISPDTGVSPTDRVTNTGGLTVTGTAEANSTVTVYDNGTLLGTTAASAAGVWALPVTLAEATHPLTATATDAAGNVSAASAPAGVLVDLTAPTTGIGSGPAAVSGSASAMFTFTGADALSGVAGFEYQLDGGAWTAAASPLTLTGLSDGAHMFAVRAVDLAGNPDPSGAAGYSWTIDTGAPAAPAITGITPDTGTSPTDRITNTGGLTVTGTAEANSTVTVYDGPTLLGTTTADAAGNWTLPTTLTETTHPLTATATDAAGNTSGASPVAPVVVDTTAPGTTITAQPAAVDGSSTATFSFTGTDVGSGVSGFEYSLDGGPWVVATSPLTLTGLADGTHTFEVRAIDVAGNPDPSGVASTSWSVDTGTPAAPVITGITPDTGASPTDRLTSTGTLTVTGTAEPNSTVTVYDNGTLLGTTTADAAGNWSLPTTLTEATHPLTATATDAAGNTSAGSTPAPVTVDTTAPVVPSVTTPTASPSTTPTIGGTAEPNSTVSVFDGSTLLGTTTADGSGTWSFTPSAPLTEGQHTITSQATDVAGNTGPASAPVTLTVSSTVAVLAAVTPDWTVGGPDYPTRFEAAGTLAPFTFTVKAGTSLPPGLTLDPTTGDVVGSPAAAGDFAFTVVATDPVGNAAERTFTIHVNPAMSSPRGDAAVLPYEIVEQTADIDLHVVGGTGTIRYAVTAGELPPGLALDPDTGRLTGTPTTRGSYFFTVTATDGVNAVFSKDFRLDVIQFPLLTSGSSGTASLGGAGAGEIGTRVNLYGVLDGNVAGTATPFAGFTGEVLVAYGDVTGDRVPEIVTTPGLGGGPRVVVMDIETGVERASFFAYDPEFRGGLTIAVGDLTGDGVADFVTGAGAGGAGHVKVFDGRTHAELASFLAFDPTFRGGARVAVADVTGDGTPDIIVGAGAGGAPHVKVFDGKTFAELASWYAFEDKFRGGVHVAGGDVYHTGLAVVVAGAGADGGPRVSVFETPGGVRRTDFFAYDLSFGGGVRVAVNDADHDGLDDLITGAGPGGGPHVRTWGIARGGAVELASFFAFDSTNGLGVYVG